MGAGRGQLITGATGFMGGYLAFNFLQGGGAPVYCLARAARGVSAERRVLDRLGQVARSLGHPEEWIRERVDESLGHRLFVVEGDVCLPALGVGEDAFRALELEEIWHVAGLMDFLKSRRTETFQVNVSGTQELLRLADLGPLRCFNYVSTAFVAGERKGAIPETPFDEQFAPNNPYEESKRVMEGTLAERHRRTGRAYRVIRPSVLVGHSVTCEPDSDDGLYGFLSNVLKVRDQLAKVKPEYLAKNPVRILADDDPYLNFVCIDHAVGAMYAIGQTAPQGEEHFHVASPRATRLADVTAAIQATIGIDLRFVSEPRLLEPYDFLLRRRTERFACYLVNRKDFDISRAVARHAPLEGATLSKELVFRLVQRYFARREAEARKEALGALDGPGLAKAGSA